MSTESRCHSVATIQWQRAVTDGAPWTLPDICQTRNFDTLPQLNRCVEARKLLVYVPCTTLPVRRTQILLQDLAILHLTRGFEAAAVSMALQWHSTSVLRFRSR